VFARTSKEGVPVPALLLSCAGAAAAVVVTVVIPASAYLYVLGVGLCGGMLVWMIGLAAHVRLRQLIASGNVEESGFRAPGGGVASGFALLAILAAMIGTYWLPELRVAVLSGIPYLAVLSIAYFFLRRKAA
jgi:L-asparagine transporter-like permease